MADKATRLTIRLGDEARTWLKAEADKRGLDEAAFARMLIYERMNGAAPAMPSAAPFAFRSRGYAAPGGETNDEIAAESGNDGRDVPDKELASAGEPRAEEMEIPPDADGGDPQAALDALMQAGPSFFDELAERVAPRASAVASRPQSALASRDRYAAPARTYRRAPTRGLQPSVGPGSMTRPVGVNGGVAGGNIQGDGYGNVLRDNMAHFGMVGTRSR